jgi:glycosyltransferase involved in cell wall biosynthesis
MLQFRSKAPEEKREHGRDDLTMRMSVLVPTYRRPDDLRRCLSALLAQTRRPEQVVIVVRDVDTDSHSVADAFKRGGADGIDVDIVTVSPPGILSAMNLGLPRMTGDVLCFTDDDAEPLPDWLERIERWYLDPSVVGVGGRDLLVQQPDSLAGRCRVVGRRSWYGRIVGNHHLALEPPWPVEVSVLKGVNMSYRRTALEGFRFDDRMASYSSSWHELDSGFFARRGGGRLIYDPSIQVRHYASPRPDGSRESPQAVYDHSHNYTYVMMKHLSWASRLVFLMYVFLVGQRATWGPVAVAYELATRRRLAPWSEIRSSIAGKCAGVRSFLGWWRDVPAGRR